MKVIKSSLIFTTFVVFGLLLEKNAEVYKW
jgi:hypothetical protein